MAVPFEDIKSPDFHISKKWHKIYQSLCGRTSLVAEAYPLFKKYTNLYILCTAIGFSLNKKEPLDKKTETPFTLEQIDTATEWPVLLAIAWRDSGQDMNIFTDSRKIISVCDQYAEAGMREFISQYPFNQLFNEEGELLNPENYELEFNAALIVQKYKNDYSLI